MTRGGWKVDLLQEGSEWWWSTRIELSASQARASIAARWASQNALDISAITTKQTFAAWNHSVNSSLYNICVSSFSSSSSSSSMMNSKYIISFHSVCLSTSLLKPWLSHRCSVSTPLSSRHVNRGSDPWEPPLRRLVGSRKIREID